MRKGLLTVVALAGLAIGSAASAAAAPQIAGTWRNPDGSVAVRTGPCGGGLCGWIVWADARAIGDARASGVPRLLGTELLEDYRPSGHGWAGTVYVPDLGSRFSSTLTPVGGAALRIRGCVIGGLICRSQIWQRAGVPDA